MTIVRPISFTNSSLSTSRECLTKYDLRYLQRLELIRDDDREALDVGTAWHKAFEAEARALINEVPAAMAAFNAIARHAPSPLWACKLARMYAAYDWYWKSQPFEVVEPERTFCVEIDGRQYEGQIDGVIKLPDGRVGLIERKTTSDSVDGDSPYWSRLRLDVQVGLYALALDTLPEFILYDVVSKPTIRQKKLSAADINRMQRELAAQGAATYYGEAFDAPVIMPAIAEGSESIELYGARLTADIGDNPASYFARREVHRTKQDFDTLRENLLQNVMLLTHARSAGLMHRNPNSCMNFNTLCQFFPLCSANIRPTVDTIATQGPPDGYRVREHTHPELVRESV